MYFFGKYYKFVSPSGFSFALIDSYSDEGKAKQIITKDGGFSLENLSQIEVKEDAIIFDVDENGILIKGEIKLGKLHPLKHNAMGPFVIFSMQCAHDVYSMHHEIEGTLRVNGESASFDGGYGYIEGDKGRSFPSEYVWYNSVGKDYGVTLAIATIPFGLIKFTGLLGFISIGEKEYRICTYNFGKIKKCTKDEVVVKRGKYTLRIKLNQDGGYLLKAPEEGKMARLIKENVSVPTSFIFERGEEVLLEKEDLYSSLEFMMKE